ncbi:MAG TPA: hypothetical protein VH542_07655 [Steroidobacteraceae bacterium]
MQHYSLIIDEVPQVRSRDATRSLPRPVPDGVRRPRNLCGPSPGVLRSLAQWCRASFVSVALLCAAGALADGAAPAANAPAASTATAPAAAPPAATAPAGASGGEFKSLDQEVQSLKTEVVELNKDLFVLEEELLFPANTQIAVFVSLDVGDFFAVDSVTLKIDDNEVANYLYTQREAEALMRGGVHRLYLGNLKVGKHELVAFFTGKGTHERDYKRGATLSFDKGIGAKYLELKISDRVRKLQPEFIVKEWE